MRPAVVHTIFTACVLLIGAVVIGLIFCWYDLRHEDYEA
jgi:hypothetical protein